MTVTLTPAQVCLRVYAGESDLAAIVELINLCKAADAIDASTSVKQLREALAEPGFDPAKDLLVAQAETGHLVAVGRMWLPPSESETTGTLALDIHPNWRQVGLEAQFLQWAAAQVKAAGQICKAEILKLRSGVRETQSGFIHLLKQHGFEPERYFDRLGRSLVEPIPAPQLPAGFTLRQVDREQDAEAWVELFNQSFIDHWNFHPITIEQFHHDTTELDYKPELDLVAVAPDGKLVAFCDCEIDESDRQAGRDRGWIGGLGTRRGYRRLGLGRAMVLAGLHQLKAAGVETAILSVDRQNPYQATQLYKSVGFSPLFASIVYAKNLD